MKEKVQRSKFRLKRDFIEILWCLGIFLFFNISTSHIAAQTPIASLTLNNPAEFEIKGGETQVFSVLLSKDQTARVEIVQNGIDVSLTAINPEGVQFIETETPSGLFGNDLILVTAEKTGEYKVTVNPANPRSKLGKYTISLAEIRPTVTEDFEINKVAKEITKLAEETYYAKSRGTVEGRHEALAKWDKIIELSKIKKDKVWKGIALTAKGLLYETLGDLQNCLEVHLQSLQIWQELGNRQYEGASVNNIGTVYGDLGEHEKAIQNFNRAIEIQRELGNLESEGIYLNNIAYSYSQLKNYDEAEKFYRRALELKRDNTSERGQRSLAATINNLGKTLVLKGDFQKGIEFLQQSLELRQKLDDRWGVANSLLNLGKAQTDFGYKTEGFKNILEANKRAAELGDRQMEAQTFYLLAVAESERQNFDKAIENVRKGLELIEKIRGELVGSQTRYAYFSTVQDFYELYTDLLVTNFQKTKDKTFALKALEMSERSRSRSLIELLQEAKVDFKQGINADLLEKLRESQDELNEKYIARQRVLSGKPKAEEVAEINNQIINLNANIQDLQTRIKRENPKYSDLTEGKTISAAQIQKLLDNDTVLLEYKLGEKRSFLWTVTKSSVEIFTLPSRQIIEEKARNFYNLINENNISRQTELQKLSKELSEILFSPFNSNISGKRLAIVSDGFLQYTPFQALRNPVSPDKFLADNYEIVILPSASVLAQLRENNVRKNVHSKTIAIFADPVFDLKDARVSNRSNSENLKQMAELKQVMRDFNFGENLPRLLFSRQEARNISNILGENQSDVSIDFDASVKNLENSDLSEYKILHFATHGFLNTSRPEFSGLVFSLYDKNGQKQDGFLSLNDIYNLEVSSDLVVLSACQTALGKEVRGEGLIGLSRGFLFAGSKSIVASLWKVDDSATAEFMKLFYRNLLEKKLPATSALQQAKLEMKKIPRYKSPFYWSAFTLLGDWK